ncbi:MAG: right-handed parallel beta-helix repeat-containing protein [Deltaproteobacteria bacterium]
MKRLPVIVFRRLALLGVGLALLPSCGLFGYETLPISTDSPNTDHCSNLVADSGETAIDCGGGSCAACEVGSVCVVGADCSSSVCAGTVCVAPSCGDGLRNQDEAGVDCGGVTCAACAESSCLTGTDCRSFVCVDSACQVPICGDRVRNQDETGVDCGGSQCAACATCADGALNQDETGVDCGGVTCAACAGSACATGADCESSVCVDIACQVPTCGDGVRNQDETGIDCGGAQCAACATCNDGIQGQDESGIDCGGTACVACPTCFDALRNQDEAGVDCGGAQCAACVTCSDGLQNQDETGSDCGGALCIACGDNTPPLARLSVTPGLGSFDGAPATVFAGDASASSDLQEAPGALSYSWDWDNDGVVDGTGLTSTHSYGSAGLFDVRLTVQDSGGLRGTATFLVIVSSSSNVVLVSTAIDENDAGATPGNPIGTGLSLREALSYANATAGRQSILVPAGFAIALASQLPSPTDTAGVDIVGDGASWDGAGTGAADNCIQIPAPQTRIFGFEIHNCRRSPLRLAFGAAGSQFSRLNVHDNSQAIILNDVNVTFGPYNEVSRSAGHCITVVDQTDTIMWNFIHDCATRGIDLTGSSSGALVIGNVITGCNPGIFFGNQADDCELAHNVLHANVGDGVWMGGLSNRGNQLQNNSFSNNTGYGVRTDDSEFSANDHNDYFGNALGTCSACSSLGAGSLTTDPGYIDAVSNDFRLRSFSPCINAGIDTGNDVNGPEPGNGLFNGSNPDIGACESP